MAVKISPIGRVSYPNVFESKQINNEGDLVFSMSLIFEPDTDLSSLEEAILASAKEKWPDKNGKSTIPKNWTSAIQDGDDKEGEEYAGRKFINVKAKEDRRPNVVDQNKAAITKADGTFYGGCYARISYTVYSWNKLGKNGTSVGLQNIQKVKDGPAFGGGRTTAEDDFGDSEIDFSSIPDEVADDTPF